MGGAVGRVAEGATRVRGALDAVRAQRRHRLARPGRRTGAPEWARSGDRRRLARRRPGRAYVNFLGDADAARTSYSEETYARLVSLKDEYDPTNVFRLNQNIEPSAAGS